MPLEPVTVCQPQPLVISICCSQDSHVNVSNHYSQPKILNIPRSVIMKWLNILLFILVINGCSKGGQETSGPTPVSNEEVQESLSRDSLVEATKSYEQLLNAFNDSHSEPLEEQLSAFAAYQEQAKVLLNILAFFPEEITTIKEVTSLLEKNKEKYEGIKALLKKFTDSKETLFESQKKIRSIKVQTDDYQLSRITENDLRDTLLREMASYSQDANFLMLTFEKELSQKELELIKDQMIENSSTEEIFHPYFNFKETLQKSETSLTTVDLGFSREDHTVAALTYESTFFKTLEENIKSIETFKRDASIFLSDNDNKNLSQSKAFIESSITKLKEIREMQKELKSDLTKILLLGYTFPKNY